MSESENIKLFNNLKQEIEGPFKGTITNIIDDIVERLSGGENILK